MPILLCSGGLIMWDKLEQQLEELVEEIDNLLLETDMLIDDIHEARKAAEKMEVSRNDR